MEAQTRRTVAADGSTLFRLILKHNATLDEDRLVLAARRDDGTFAQTPFGEELLVPSGYNVIEASWGAGDGNGYLLVAINSVPLAGLENLTNSLSRLDFVRLGAVGGTVTTSAGTVHLDEFQSFH